MVGISLPGFLGVLRDKASTLSMPDRVNNNLIFCLLISAVIPTPTTTTKSLHFMWKLQRLLSRD
jgi:hypothetical protein